MTDCKARDPLPRCDGDVQIVMTDPDFLLVYKPEFLLTTPGSLGAAGDSLIQRLREQYPTAKTCHRLDLDTSGIVVVALNPGALAAINRQFEERRVRKVYEAVVYGLVAGERGTIDLPIAPDWQHRPQCKVCYVQGKSALTEYEVMERNPCGPTTRLRLLPKTGRTHQLRLHLKEIGHPILGCDLYAHAEALAMSSRLLLHASEIAFSHPRTGLPVELRVAPPF